MIFLPCQQQYQRILSILIKTNRRSSTNYTSNNNINKIHKRKCSTTTNNNNNNNNTSSTNSKNEKSNTFYRLARIGRYLGLGYVLYQSGYYHGLKWYAKDPYEADKILTKNFIKSNSIDKRSDSIVNEDHIDYIRVNLIAKNICQTAIRFSQNKIDNLLEERKTIKDKLQLDSNKEEIKMWQDNLRKLNGNWQIVLIKSKIPNAFVSELVPHKIFINSAIIYDLKATDDEIALLLGHELSHLLLEHGENKRQLDEILVVIAVAMMTFVDPTGWFALFFDSFISTGIGLIKAGFSRHEEIEADHLGIQLTSMSCYNPVKGAILMKKFSELDQHSSNNTSLSVTSWNSTHPSPMSRYEDLTVLGKKYQQEYQNYCSSLLSSWGSLFKK